MISIRRPCNHHCWRSRENHSTLMLRLHLLVLSYWMAGVLGFLSRRDHFVSAQLSSVSRLSRIVVTSVLCAVRRAPSLLYFVVIGPMPRLIAASILKFGLIVAIVLLAWFVRASSHHCTAIRPGQRRASRSFIGQNWTQQIIFC